MRTRKVTRNYRRRQYVINKRFQFHLLGEVFLIAFAVLASFVFAINLYFLTGPGMEAYGLETTVFAEPVAWSFSSLPAMLFLGVCLTVLAWVGFRATHTIAGPIYRFGCVARAVRAGDYDVPTVRSRKRDEFKELADDLSGMMDSLRARRDKVRDSARVLSENLQTLERLLGEEQDEWGGSPKGSTPNGDGHEAKQCFARMRKACSELTELSK